MVDQHERMAARLRMFECESVTSNQLVKHRGPAGGCRLFHPRMRLVTHVHERVELRGMAGGAGLGGRVGYRPLAHAPGARRIHVLTGIVTMHTVHGCVLVDRVHVLDLRVTVVTLHGIDGLQVAPRRRMRGGHEQQTRCSCHPSADPAEPSDIIHKFLLSSALRAP